MRCNKCNSEVQGGFCSNCGTKLSEKYKNRKLLGFRSNKVWKKILSVLYMIFCLIMFLACFSGRQGKITTYDFFIEKLFEFVLLLCFITPYIFLSNTKLRQKLPLFKKYKAGASAGGLAIVIFVLVITIGIVNSQHSAEYQADMTNHADVIVSKTEATCTDKGKISYVCDYCARTKEEIIPAIGHNYIETSKTEATCTDKGIILSKCTACGDEIKIEVVALGHNMEEVSRVEATTDKDGEIVFSCRRCEHTTTEKISNIESNTNTDNSKENSTTISSSFEDREQSSDTETTETEAPIRSHFVGKDGCTYNVSATFDCDGVIYQIHSVKISSDRDSESPDYNFYKIFFDFSIKNERSAPVDWNTAYYGNLYGQLCHRGVERRLGGNSNIKDDNYSAKKRMPSGALTTGQSSDGYVSLVCTESIDNPKDTWPLYTDEPFELELHLVVNDTDYKFKIQFNQ